MAAAQRFPLQPLLDYLGIAEPSFGPVAGPVGRLSDLLGVGRRTVYRWQRNGMSAASADRAAIGAGTHPAVIWPEWVKQ